jgi:hypothetical protein
MAGRIRSIEKSTSLELEPATFRLGTIVYELTCSVGRNSEDLTVT